eukprot:c11319_g1_i1.p1 GENE.c11319_g1_i1~~c11319_g1_i1.p1  ORF type:complete len:212 (+),score=25.49 c11319_g1_i1:3-638(+)
MASPNMLVARTCDNRIIELVHQSNTGFSLFDQRRQPMTREHSAETCSTTSNGPIENSRADPDPEDTPLSDEKIAINPNFLVLNQMERIHDDDQENPMEVQLPLEPKAAKKSTKSQRRRDIRCPTCRKSFRNVHDKTVHIRTHTGEKPYQCPEPGCNKAFAQTGGLTRHKRVHTGERPYACCYCEKRFTESCHRTRHQGTCRVRSPKSDDDC